MDLAGLEAARDSQAAAKQQELADEEGDACTLLLQLPDGTQVPHKFTMGATVACVKLQCEQRHGIPMDKMTLKTAAGKTLIDPLSLADCPGISACEASLVIVEVAG